MLVRMNMNLPHRIVSANSHYYKNPTEPLYIDRTLQYHDLIYIKDGTWMITENEVDYPLEKGDILLLSAGYHHYTRVPCSPHTRTYCIHVTREAGDLDPDGSTLSVPSFIPGSVGAGIKHYFDDIVSLFWSDKTCKQERMSALFYLLMQDLSDLFKHSSQQQRNIVDKIIHLINSTPDVRYNAGDIAQRFSLSVKAVDAAMQQCTGMSLSKFQMSRKLEMVASQIEVEPEVHLAEMAALFGFCDEFHLSRSFKQKYGVSPSQYRESMIGGGSKRNA